MEETGYGRGLGPPGPELGNLGHVAAGDGRDGDADSIRRPLTASDRRGGDGKAWTFPHPTFSVFTLRGDSWRRGGKSV